MSVILLVTGVKVHMLYLGVTNGRIVYSIYIECFKIFNAKCNISPCKWLYGKRPVTYYAENSQFNHRMRKMVAWHLISIFPILYQIVF